MKQTQDWLGHNFNTTVDVYSHLDFSSKIEFAEKIATALNYKKKNTESNDDEKKLEDYNNLQAKLKELGIKSIDALLSLLNQK